MPTTEDIEHKFWKALRSDMTVMLGIEGNVPQRPMTAQLADDADHGPIWFFTSSETELARALRGPQKATMTFVSKGHDLFASAAGALTLSHDRAMVEKLWNPFVAAWYEQGKDDPKLALLRLDADDATIWLDGSSILAGLKILVGADPKDDYKDKIAKVSLA